MTPRFGNFIGGEYRDPATGEYLESTNPATLAVLYELADSDERDVAAAVAAAADAFASGPWQRMTATARGHLLRRLGDLVGEHADELAEYESLDNGKLLREMRGQMRGLPEYLYYYAGLADKVQGATIPAANTDIFNFTLREPIGVVGAITPWNSPLTLTTSKLAPALAAGNTLVIKPSEYTTRAILRFAELALGAGFPAGVVNVVTGTGVRAGAPLVDHPQIAKISFTGSTATGSAIAAKTAARFVTTTLELGGKSPQLVFGDADIESAATGVVAGVFAAAGQTCIAGSRVYAHKSVYDELLERVTQRAASIRLGNPLDDATELGPIAFSGQYDKVREYIAIGEREGANLHFGGRRPEIDLPGYFLQPTIFTDTTQNMRIVQEEIFGPVTAIMPFETEEEALRLANDTSYGLAAGVWTRDLNRMVRLARSIDAGTIWFNMYRMMSPQSPRQGFKNSGVGTEHGLESITEYTRLKSVWVNTDESPAADPFVMRTK